MTNPGSTQGNWLAIYEVITRERGVQTRPSACVVRSTARASEACGNRCDRNPIDVATARADTREVSLVSRPPVHMKTYQRDAFRGHNAVMLQVNRPVNEIMAQLPCCSCGHHYCVDGSDLSGLLELPPLTDKMQTPNSVLPRRPSFQFPNSQLATWLHVKTDHSRPRVLTGRRTSPPRRSTTARPACGRRGRRRPGGGRRSRR